MSAYYFAGTASMAFLLAGCLHAATLFQTIAPQESKTAQEPKVIQNAEESDETYDVEGAAEIRLLNDHAELETDALNTAGVELNEAEIVIRAPGTYVFTGELYNGTIVVEAEADDTVRLVLNGVSLSNNSGAALYIKQADTVIVTVPTSTKNRIEGNGVTEEQECGGIIGIGNLMINGGGSLEINSDSGSAIVYEGNVRLMNTMATLHSKANGIEADTVEVSDCILCVTSGFNAIETKTGDAAIYGGVLNLVAQHCGIRTNGDLISSSSEIHITANENDIDCLGEIVTVNKDNIRIVSDKK